MPNATAPQRVAAMLLRSAPEVLSRRGLIVAMAANRQFAVESAAAARLEHVHDVKFYGASSTRARRSASLIEAADRAVASAYADA